MPFDAYAWVLTDPETTVGSAPLAAVPALAELPELIRLRYCTAVNRWTTLGDDPVALLAEVTGWPVGPEPALARAAVPVRRRRRRVGGLPRPLRLLGVPGAVADRRAHLRPRRRRAAPRGRRADHHGAAAQPGADVRRSVDRLRPRSAGPAAHARPGRGAADTRDGGPAPDPGAAGRCRADRPRRGVQRRGAAPGGGVRRGRARAAGAGAPGRRAVAHPPRRPAGGGGRRGRHRGHHRAVRPGGPAGVVRALLRAQPRASRSCSAASPRATTPARWPPGCSCPRTRCRTT